LTKGGEADEDLDNLICLKTKRDAMAAAEVTAIAYQGYATALARREAPETNDEDLDNVICLKARRNAEDASGLYNRFAEAISQVPV
jgi:hypothetical protein